jgi:hypothetical protein
MLLVLEVLVLVLADEFYQFPKASVSVFKRCLFNCQTLVLSMRLPLSSYTSKLDIVCGGARRSCAHGNNGAGVVSIDVEALQWVERVMALGERGLLAIEAVVDEGE